MYELEILHHCGKRVKTKSLKVLGANFYVCRSYREKTGREAFLPPSWIWIKLMVKYFWSAGKNDKITNQNIRKTSTGQGDD